MLQPNQPNGQRNIALLDSRWCYRIARFILAAVFLYAGGIKLFDPSAFAQVISGYGLVPVWSLYPLAVALPLLEVLAAIALLFDTRGGLAVLTGLTVVFMLVLWHGMRLGLDIDCGCYGPEDPEAEAYHGLGQALLRDAGLLVLCIYCYWWRWRHKPKLATLMPFGFFPRGKKRSQAENGGARCTR